MESTNFSVEFSFNNSMYKQTDGVVVGSLLGPTLDNIFVGYYKKKLFSQTQKPPTYSRYVDDTFAIFDHETEADKFLTKLKCILPSLRFTIEKRKENVYRFWMFRSKEQILALKPVYNENPLSPASIYIRSSLVLSNVK